MYRQDNTKDNDQSSPSQICGLSEAQTSKGELPTEAFKTVESHENRDKSASQDLKPAPTLSHHLRHRGFSLSDHSYAKHSLWLLLLVFSILVTLILIGLSIVITDFRLYIF